LRIIEIKCKIKCSEKFGFNEPMFVSVSASHLRKVMSVRFLRSESDTDTDIMRYVKTNVNDLKKIEL